MFRVNTCVSVLVALVCLSAPSFGRSWRGSHDDHKSWGAEPNDGPQQSNRGRDDYDSSEDRSYDSKEDYQDFGYGHDKFEHFGYHHNHEGHFDHHNHGDYEYHHQPVPNNHKGHQSHSFDNKHDFHGHHGWQESYVPPSFGLHQNNKDYPAHKTGSKPKPASPSISQNRDQFAKNYGDQVKFPEDSHIPNSNTQRIPPISSLPTHAVRQSPAVAAQPLARKVTPPNPVVTQPPNSKVTQPPVSSTTISPLALQDIVRCIRDCPVTQEFNPICGTNNVTYNNHGELECARNCGVNVALRRPMPCPMPQPPAFFFTIPMISTERPIVNARMGEKSGAPLARSSSEQAQTLPPAAVKPTRFTNIDLGREVDTDRRTSP